MREYIVVRFDNEHTLVKVIRTTDLDIAVEELKHDFRNILRYKYGDSWIEVYSQCAQDGNSIDDESFLTINGASSEAACYNTNVNGTDYNWAIL